MKSLLLLAALSAAASGYDIHFTSIDAHAVACAQRIVGKELAGVGTVRVAETRPNDEGQYLVKIASPAAHGEGRMVTMLLRADQICEFADSLEPARP